MPLAEVLGVTVTELLECHRIEAPQPMAADQVEAIVKKAVSYQEAETEKRKLNTRWLVPYIICAVLATVQLVYLKHVLAIRSVFYSAIQTGVILSSVFGAYFCLLAKDKLPTFYDDNKISFYSDGPVRMNITGLNLNNSNWPHIVRYIRFWTLLSMVLFALVAALSFGVFTYLGYRFGFYLPEGVVSSVAILVILLFSLVIPVYCIGNKYQ